MTAYLKLSRRSVGTESVGERIALQLRTARTIGDAGGEAAIEIDRRLSGDADAWDRELLWLLLPSIADDQALDVALHHSQELDHLSVDQKMALSRVLHGHVHERGLLRVKQLVRDDAVEVRIAVIPVLACYAEFDPMVVRDILRKVEEHDPSAVARELARQFR